MNGSVSLYVHVFMDTLVNMHYDVVFLSNGDSENSDRHGCGNAGEGAAGKAPPIWETF